MYILLLRNVVLLAFEKPSLKPEQMEDEIKYSSLQERSRRNSCYFISSLSAEGKVAYNNL